MLLDQFKVALKEKTYGELNGSLFSFKISTSREIDAPSAVIAMIDEHQEKMSQLVQALQIEKLKQELELHEQLSPSKSSKAVEDDPTKKEIVEQLSHLKVCTHSYASS